LLLLVTHTGTVFQAVCNILHIVAATHFAPDVVDVFQRDTFSCCNRKSYCLALLNVGLFKFSKFFLIREQTIIGSVSYQYWYWVSVPIRYWVYLASWCAANGLGWSAPPIE